MGLEKDESDDDMWGGIPDDEESKEIVDHEEEYIDEDRYTTVTIEEVDISKLDGVQKKKDVDSGDDEDEEANHKVKGKESEKPKKVWPKKPKVKKFRYETKVERKMTRGKQIAKNKTQAAARKEAGG